MSLRIVLADDHQIVREGLAALLTAEADFQLAGQAASESETLALIEKCQPDILVLDMMMPHLVGLEVTRQTVRKSPGTRVIILSMLANVAYVVEALAAGASAYVLKEASSAELVRAIREVQAGRQFLSSAISKEEMAAYRCKAERTPLDPYNKLTAREREVLQLTAEGLSGNEVSERLFISARTVETHRANLMRKLGVRNQKELIRYAIQRGLLPLERQNP